jgi:hypothetical protein
VLALRARGFSILPQGLVAGFWLTACTYPVVARAFAVITAANLASFGLGELAHRADWFSLLFRR